jgi:ligand-binding sensor domain-containing protein
LRKTIILIGCLLCVLFAWSQVGKQFSFVHYNADQGKLLSNQVNAVVQDAEGYMWIATTDGLQRFDGIRFTSFRHRERDSTSIPSNQIWRLLIDKQQNLWLLFADGKLGIFDTKKFSFRQVPVHVKNKASLNTPIKRFVLDAEGHLFYLIGAFEVLSWDKKANAFSFTNNFFKQKAEWGIADFVHQPGTQKYWIAIQGGGFAVYNHATGNLSYAGNNVEKEPLIDQADANTIPYNLFFDKQNRLWFIAWKDVPLIQCFDMQTGKPLIRDATINGSLKTYHEIHGFFQQSDGTIWLKGLLVFAHYMEKENRFELVQNGFQNERSIAYESINWLYEDKEKNIWVATDNNGLFRFNPSNEYFNNIKHLNRITGKVGEGSPMSFATTRWGTMLMGTWGDGLYQFDKDLNAIPTNIKGIDNKLGPSVWSMFASTDSNTIWLAAQPGVYKIDQQNRRSTFYNPPVLENKTVRQIVEDKHGNLWLGMQHIGVFKWTKDKGETNFDKGMEAFTAIPRVMVNKITIDAKGLIWIVTGVEGLYVIDPDTDKIIMHFGEKEEKGRKMPEAALSSVLAYDDSLMIITTSSSVIKYNRLTHRSSYLGMPGFLSGFIASMEKDKHGYLWLTTTSGLYRINVHKRIIIRFTRPDGIDNEHFILASSFVLPDGRIVFGNTNSFIIFHPDSIHLSSSFPDIHITNFSVGNKMLPVDSLMQLKEIALSAEQNSLLIEFSTLLFNGVNLIKYKLEGLDKEWKMADLNNQAIYSYLPPGRYLLMLKTMDEEGNESTKSTILHIHIEAPFWRTWWFYGLLALLVIAILFWFDKERAKRKAAMQQMRSEIANNLHVEVNTALSNINILSEMANLKVDKDIDKSKEYIQQIHSKSHNMIVAMDDMLWSINPENDSMGKALLRMREFIDSLNNHHDAQIEVLFDKKVEALQLNMKFKYEALYLFKECMLGLMQAGAKQSSIHVGLEKGNLLFNIELSNEQCDLQQLNSLLQRQDLVKRMEAIKAKLVVDIRKSNSHLELKVPVV